MPETPTIIRTSLNDNTGIVANQDGLPRGTLIDYGILLAEDIPFGHKVALEKIRKGGKITRYGQIIGYATKHIKCGEWIRESMISLPLPPDLDAVPFNEDLQPESDPLEGYTFKGFRNPDGTAGTKNILGITTSVNCVSGFASYIAGRIRKELLPMYPGVDDVVPLNHNYGCGIAINAPDAVIPIRTIRNIARNPNFGGHIMIIGLGCEKLLPEELITEKTLSPDQKLNYVSDVLIMQDDSLDGFGSMSDEAMKLAKKHLESLNDRKREDIPASELIVGMQCGGSDAFSGITSNPVAGFAADLIVRAGGSVLFSEVTEVRDAIHLMIPRTINSSVGKALINEMKWYDSYLLKGGADRSANPAPGNKEGGLSNIVEKALGSVVKSGTTPIVDVVGPGERIRRKGLTFAATPAGDFICGTLQVAAGMNVHVFMTGRGTPYGLSMVPVIKISSNSKLGRRWHDLIDLDAGQVALGQKTIPEMGWELFHLILKVASGEEQVACDRLSLHNDLVLFNPGPVT